MSLATIEFRNSGHNRFGLRHPLQGEITDIPAPDRIVLPLCGLGLFAVQGEKVLAGQRIAQSTRPGRGDLHSPICGRVEAIDADSVTIVPNDAPSECEGAYIDGQNSVAPAYPQETSPDVLAADLNTMGIDTFDLRPCKTLVINGLNPEPSVTSSQRILAEHSHLLQEGLALAAKLTQPKQIILALPKGSRRTLPPCKIHLVPARYPYSLAPLVAWAVTGSESLRSTIVLGLDRLLDMGRARHRGQPATLRIVTVQGTDYRVHTGTPLGHLLSHAGISPLSGDKIMLGGPMRGQAQMSLDAPVTRDTYAVSLFPKGEFLSFENNPCCNCGECTRVCPARIPVGLMTRSCEFGKYSMALQYDIESCFDCGMCSYVCPMHRPLAQYIELGKSELAKSAALTGQTQAG